MCAGVSAEAVAATDARVLIRGDTGHRHETTTAAIHLQDVTCEKHVLGGDPAHEIVNRARAAHADLIVMGSVGRTGLPYMLMGSTAVKVARHLV